MSKRIVTFGEIMLRWPPTLLPLLQTISCRPPLAAASQCSRVAGQLRMDAAFVTKLPAHAIGQAPSTPSVAGVDTRSIVRAATASASTIWKRCLSRAACASTIGALRHSEAQPSDFDWDVIFDGADWFHFTGITPRWFQSGEICKEACVAAKKHGVKISCDLNYRGKLWTREQARAAMTELCRTWTSASPMRGRQGCVRHRGGEYRHLRRQAQ